LFDEISHNQGFFGEFFTFSQLLGQKQGVGAQKKVKGL
jgi:hypothetical protein